MNNIIYVFKREYKRAIKSKLNIFLLIIMPIFASLLFGYMYQEQTVKHIKLAVINHSPSSESRSVINDYIKHERIDVVGELESEADIQDKIKSGQIDAALIIPEDYTSNVKKGRQAEVYFGVDNTNLSKGSMSIISSIDVFGYEGKRINTEKFMKMGYSEEFAEITSSPISLRVENFYNPLMGYGYFLVIGYVCAIIQVMLFLLVAPSIVEERKSGSISDLIEKKISAWQVIFAKSMVYTTGALLSFTTAIGIIHFIFDYPFKGSFWAFIILMMASFFAISMIGTFISLIARNALDAVQYSMIIALPSFIISGYTWPEYAMPEAFKTIIQFLPLTYFAVNVREIMLIGLELEYFINDIFSLLIMGAVFAGLSIYIYHFRFFTDKHLFSEKMRNKKFMQN